VDFENVARELQETLAVVMEVQRSQAELQKLDADGMEDLRRMAREGMIEHEKWMVRIQRTLREAGEKLKRLTGEWNATLPMNSLENELAFLLDALCREWSSAFLLGTRSTRA
jgi:hypothetical protein